MSYFFFLTTERIPSLQRELKFFYFIFLIKSSKCRFPESTKPGRFVADEELYIFFAQHDIFHFLEMVRCQKHRFSKFRKIFRLVSIVLPTEKPGGR